MAQLESSERGLARSEITALRDLGPMPWLSLTGSRSPRVLQAWKAVAAQLPAHDLASAEAAELHAAALTFAESEEPDETGGNDTPETGDAIDGFGTGDDEESLVTITGNLSGGEVRPPIEGDCESVEDDGDIGKANPTPAAEIQVALCIGEIGDGPFGDSSGDIDFYSYGEIEEGSLLILDTYHIAGSLDPVNSVIGIYDAAGTLLGSLEDGGVPGDDPVLEVIAPATGVYYAAIAGCCELPTDPFDSSSGTGVGDLGTYELFVVTFPPPCTSSEDDGSIALANETNVPGQGFDFCSGIIGDGPHGASDTDFFSVGFVDTGSVLLADVLAFEEPVGTIIGVYNAAGELVASAEDSSDPEAGDYLEFQPDVAGEYFVAVSGCCTLPEDPTDPASGSPSDESGLYEVLIEVFFAPCSSTEDDGSIGQSNETLVSEQGGEFCEGEIGDGPHGAADTDFYSIGTVPVDFEIVADVFAFDGPLRTVVGIYNDEGDLVASGEDGGDPEEGDFLRHTVTEEAEYFVAVAGCCELQSDPNDSATGSPSDEAGTYGIGMSVGPPPCESSEDDGSIAAANDASNVQGGDELWLVDCFGAVGDGPQAELNGDVDFFRTRVLPEGRLLIVDFIDVFGEAAGAGDLTIGIYNEAGDLIGSGSDDPSEGGPESDFFSVTIPAEGPYFIAVGGGLPTDPTDPATGTNTDIVSGYSIMTVVDTTEEFLGGGQANWGGAAPIFDAATARPEEVQRAPRRGPVAELAAKLSAAKTVASAAAEVEPAVDIDFFLVDLDKGDAISGGFDSSRVTGILDPAGVQRSGSEFNPSFIYPAASPLAHGRRTGFDHVATVDGVHAVFVGEGVGAYEGELRLVRSGLAPSAGDEQQIIFLDFDGAIIPEEVFQNGLDAELSPLSAFLGDWGLGPDDEDAVIDATIDAVIESLDTDLRVLDGRNGDRDASGTPTEFDVEVLNSRDHGEQWGQPNVTRVVVGGTIDELQIPTLGIAQSIDPGNTETEETAVVLLDEMSGPVGSPVSINTYGLADGVAKTAFIGFAVGHITVHEIGHLIGNWHQETFNDVQTVMDAGGDFPAIAGVGPDLIFGTADDTDPDFEEDEFDLFEGFTGIEDTAGRSAFALSTGQLPVAGGNPLADLTIEIDGVAYPGEPVDLYGRFVGGVAPFAVEVNWGDGSACPGAGGCSVDPNEGGPARLVDASHTFDATGVFSVEVTITDFSGASISATVDTAACTIIGTPRSEKLSGTEDDDVICGLGGNDRMFGNGGNDIMFGGSGRDMMDGGSGTDHMFGGSGDDDMRGRNGVDTMSGGSGNDTMRGGDAADVMNGRTGKDRLFGDRGGDMMFGGRDNDRLFGGMDDDEMYGEHGADQLFGQNDDDDLRGGQGPDILSGAAGDDDLDGGDDNDRCAGGTGSNTLTACER